MSPDQFISRVYRESPHIPLTDFIYWSLDLLQQVISFDGAIWGTGHIESRKFHTQATVDVSNEIFTALKNTLDINPIFDKLISSKGRAVDMSDVITDDKFYQSKLFKECFEPFDIERILSSIHLDERSGIFTLLTLYRYEREHCFTLLEKKIQSRLLYHLLSAYSHRQFLALNESQITSNLSTKNALCDKQGIYHCIDPAFLDVLESDGCLNEVKKFPWPIDENVNQFKVGSLVFNQEKLGDLFRISVRIESQLDKLTNREQEVVTGICHGSTFKQIARQLDLSLSTVSNHLYRIYLKLNINTRSELVTLVKKNK